MDRKQFLRRGLLGSSIFVASATGLSALSNKIEELEALEPMTKPENLGFNHIPNTQSEVGANMVLHKAESRGDANHGWLRSRHSFSFANYYNPERMHFGALRVLNDDIVSAGMGFPTHPHDNMEIISIPLEGDLEHKDNMGNVTVIKKGDVQVMSAGTGITHSEYNKNSDREVKFLQIWLFPNKRNLSPRYDQISLRVEDRRNRLQQILSPNADDEGVWIHQKAWFHLADLDKDIELEYQLKEKENGIYIFNLSGDLRINQQLISRRDGLGLWGVEKFSLKAESRSEFLLMEVPMSV